ncbi:MAG: hypothetical protein EZS28_001713 [Streblomastix strix]|uniref:Uncharacterized protein n=1 Tax=Streblomastix strix TaxID=222440 RepID=A0A5J4X828_9EUKA|nr:MAG: hypothetical protein EZS28_001713 [Streblomastix strix]
MSNNTEEDFAYIILHKPVEDNISSDSSAILDEIRLYISQIREYKTNIEFMKYLLHLVIVAQIKQIKELNKIVKSTSLANTLLQILIDINSPENDELIVVTAILCAIGALDQVKLLAQNEDCLFGEDFIVWAEFDENSNKDQAISLDKYIQQQDQYHQQQITDLLDSEKEENSQSDPKKHQSESEENVILEPMLLGQVFEKKVFRVKNKFIDSLNSRRFGFIAAEDEIMNNIPVPGKNFRAITYDEKDGIIRLGWLEVFRWIPSSRKKRKITFELDLQESIPQTAIRIFYGKEESPILFVNVPKQLKIYLAYDNLPGTKYKNKIFEIPKPSQKKNDKQ